MKAYFSADYHLGHANIIRYCNRPFIKYEDLNKDNEWKSNTIKLKRCQWMNETIIKNHNRKLTDDDILYHLGDFCFRSNSQYWESMLNGKIIHILGNHDKNNNIKSYITFANMKIGGLNIYATHKPPEERQVDTVESHYVANCDIILCGHVHNNWKYKWIEVWNQGCRIKKLCINVGVDVWGYEPITIHSILKLIARIKKEK